MTIALPGHPRESSRKPSFRFSGHETFACRFAWIPKACQLILEAPSDLAHDESAMVKLGLGKNMVRSLRFWVESMGVAVNGPLGLQLTKFGESVFGRNGLDRYSERPETAWLLHWKLASRRNCPLFAWHVLFNKWPYPEFSRSELFTFMQKEAIKHGFNHSKVTLEQHLDVLIHTYLPARASVALEDSLDGPLAHLELLGMVGEGGRTGTKREPLFTFRKRWPRDLSSQLLLYVVSDFFEEWRSGETTLTLGDLCNSEGSPGRVLRLGEHDLRDRLEVATDLAGSPFVLSSSAVQTLLTRKEFDQTSLLRGVYHG